MQWGTEMKRSLLTSLTLISLILFFLTYSQTALARDLRFHFSSARLPGEQIDDRPPNLAPPLAERGGPDTLSFGYVDGEGFAIEGDTWTFDHGDADPFEGWTTEDMTAQSRSFFRHITAAIWATGDIDNGNEPTDNSVTAPILSGLGSAWLGAFQNEADELCWDAGLGYGNSWCQELEGPVLDHDGSSSITIDFEYFNDTEPDFDYSFAILRTLPSGTETELARFADQIGLAPDHPTSAPIGADFSAEFSNFQDDTQFQLVFRMTADRGWSDEDGEFTTEYGPFAVDNVALGNTGTTGTTDVTYDFESDLNGWTPTSCPGFGSFAGIADISSYVIEDACTCQLAGKVLEHHDDNREHPYGQNTQAQSPPVDVQNDVNGVLSGPGQLEIFADWSQYSIQPRANGVFYRPGWNYFPFVCPNTGAIGWSGRVGQTAMYYTGPAAFCFEERNIATDVGIPAQVEQIRFIHEILASCDGFGIPPEECTGVTNFTPIIDNIRIRFTLTPEAPPLAYDPGDRYTDGFSQSLLLDPNVPGNANTVINISFGDRSPIINGDSLRVVGPIPSEGFEYDTRLWFRVARKGPGTNTFGYDAWRAVIETDGGIDAGVDSATDIENGDFATAKMDSAQIGANPRSNVFLSYFIEEDARFALNGTPELTEGQEIIRDGVLLPGTSIEYFVTGNYVNSSPVQFSLLPDTSGGFFDEFEILPNWRYEDDRYRFPCLLYIDAANDGAQFYIEGALSALGYEVDRYDYLDASSSWKAPLARDLLNPNSNNGVSVLQLLAGYRGILVNTGSNVGHVMWPVDYALFSDYLTSWHCDANDSRQGLILNGDNIASILETSAPVVLNGILGATLNASAYREQGGTPDVADCVRLESPTLGSPAYGTTHSEGDYEYDAWGNGCPSEFQFDVLGAVGSGVGNRAYVRTDTGEETFYNQVVNHVGPSGNNYRTVLGGVSWHHMSERDASFECVADSAHIVTAAANEIRAAIEWIFGVAPIDDQCELYECHTSDVPVDISAGATTRIFQNVPNPFSPVTTLRFSLATDGPVELVIFDVSGRRVKTLIDGVLEAGSHEVVWDGTNEAGQELSAGVYWSQFEALGMRSNKKMILLRR